MCKGTTTTAAEKYPSKSMSNDNIDVPTQQQQEQQSDEEDPNPSSLRDVDLKEDDNAHQKDSKNDVEQQQPEEEKTTFQKVLQWLIAFYWTNEFVLLVILAICLAKAYPPLGAIYLFPKITATWIAVMFIFLLAGIELKTSEFTNAFQQLRFNVFVQVFNFGVVSSVVYGVSRGLVEGQILDKGIADGMVVCASLPMTINMVVVLTKTAGGDEAAAIFNAAFGNMIGVFLSPVLILGYLSVSSDINLVDVFIKLAIRVVLPVVVGQILQKTVTAVVEFVKTYKKYFKQVQQYTLVFIVYTVFCTTFMSTTGTGTVAGIFTMVAFILLLLVSLMAFSWTLLRLFFKNDPKLCVMGLYGCTHKTVAMGIPLINAMYESDPKVGLYTLPLLIWHPMQLILGSYATPYLSKFVEEQLALLEQEDKDTGGSSSQINEGDEEGTEQQNP